MAIQKSIDKIPSLSTVHFRVDVRITGTFFKVELHVWELFAV